MQVDSRTPFGYEVRLTGHNRRFTEYAGVDVAADGHPADAHRRRHRRPDRRDGRHLGALPLHRRRASGAGLHVDRARSPRCSPGANPLGTVAAGVFFAALQVGGFGMERETEVPRELSSILQATVIVHPGRDRRRDVPGGPAPEGRRMSVLAELIDASIVPSVLRRSRRSCWLPSAGPLCAKAGVFNVGLEGSCSSVRSPPWPAAGSPAPPGSACSPRCSPAPLWRRLLAVGVGALRRRRDHRRDRAEPAGRRLDRVPAAHRVRARRAPSPIPDLAGAPDRSLGQTPLDLSGAGPARRRCSRRVPPAGTSGASGCRGSARRPRRARSLGVDTAKYRYGAVLASGVLCGLGGAQLVPGQRRAVLAEHDARAAAGSPSWR